MVGATSERLHINDPKGKSRRHLVWEGRKEGLNCVLLPPWHARPKGEVGMDAGRAVAVRQTNVTV